MLKVVWNHLKVGASPSDAHPTLHKDQLALLCKEDKVKEKDG